MSSLWMCGALWMCGVSPMEHVLTIFLLLRHTLSFADRQCTRKADYIPKHTGCRHFSTGPGAAHDERLAVSCRWVVKLLLHMQVHQQCY